jgi:hypothetical protein
MGGHIPRLVSPITGHEEAAPSTGFVFEPTEANLARWRRWWRFANWEQMLTVPVITVFTIAFMSMLASSTIFGREDLPNGIGLLVIGAFSLFAAAMGIVDHTSRLAADQLKTCPSPRPARASSASGWCPPRSKRDSAAVAIVSAAASVSS